MQTLDAPTKEDVGVDTILSAFEEIELLNKSWEEEHCEVDHADRTDFPCTHTPTHIIARTCDGLSGKACLNAARATALDLTVYGDKMTCEKCGRVANDCWTIRPYNKGGK